VIPHAAVTLPTVNAWLTVGAVMLIVGATLSMIAATFTVKGRVAATLVFPATSLAVTVNV
jgi:hypothetical protein